MTGRSLRLLLAFVITVGLGAACDRGGSASSDRTGRVPTTSAASSVAGAASGPAARGGEAAHPFDPAVDVPIGARPRGGSARVGVWGAPDPAAATIAGAAVRSLVLPQLFVARADGRWSSMLAQPGSDRTADDRRSASLRLRGGAVWSDGTPITADDLRRTADARFVAGVDGPDAAGAITVRFTQELPGWRRLWSGDDVIGAPTPGVWGGPFVMASVTPGLETVLVRNDRWWGAPAPFLDELHLVLVPDPTTARLLLARNELDVLMPLAGTVRTPQLEAIPDVTVQRAAQGGWTVSLEANPARLDLDRRRALLATFDRVPFVATLLRDEAARLDGFAPASPGEWAGIAAGDAAALRGTRTDLVGFGEEPMTGLVYRSMQRRARAVEGTIELRSAEADRVEGWLRAGSYDAALVVRPEPLATCWACRWPDVAGVREADGGDVSAAAAVDAALRDEARVLPLWRGSPVVAVRSGLTGTAANGYALGPAWNAWEWWRPTP